MSEIKPLREKISELEVAGKERDKKLDRLEKNGEELKEDLRRIIFLLDNDKATDSKGLVARVQDLQKIHSDINSKVDAHINVYKTDKKVQNAKTLKYGGSIGAIAAMVVTAVIKFLTGNTN